MTNVVIVGIGEIKDRPDDPSLGLDPLDLMAAAARRAEADSGARILDRIDAVEVVHQITWRYEDTARRLCERLGIDPARAAYHPGGGESPLRIMHDAALRIASGETRIALVCGGEARSTVRKARKAGVALPWPAKASAVEHPWRVEEMLSAMGRAHGIAQPTYIYPLFENATLHAWGMTPGEAQTESARLWSRYSAVAADNPHGWLQRPFTPAEIETVSRENPLVAWPYPKLMVANPSVNQGAAVLLMSEAEAREMGIATDAMIHIAGGAASKEPEDYLDRDCYHSSPSQQAVLQAAAAINGAPFDHFELYSCFPCVPKMARRTLGLPGGFTPTVAGGLTFFGGPFNNYMLHATCAMVRRLREGRGSGLLYGQGDFVTKHHALVLSAAPGAEPLSSDYRVDGKADALRGPVPIVVDHHDGDATVESFTVIYGRENAIDRAIAILRTPEGYRTMARVPADDAVTIERLTDPARSPIGERGIVTTADDGLLEWRLS
ncbi:acetyl-CoA acetyltransferase [Sphingobium chlorophenolicum L-1]|uniref:Acetyl-CoA acetyltransferase n=1 Tax=Sphingobium chlorophenolicum L-1 TaxID=690566 RepID=F6F1U5_SPHCR|nr:acetyl-CoA acetyltransferase [Sphingobium chlorophenolicum]AEG51511.1 acetyl-CoA acetyltransferase [Sphingobium chlorophenolicum L-1]